MSFLKRKCVPDIITAIENILRIGRVWREGATRTQLYLAWANTVSFSIIVFFFVIYTFADFNALLRDFKVDDVLGNLGGRLVALTFAIVAAHYYANIFSMLRITARHRGLRRAANIVMGFNAFFYFFPIMIAIV